MREIAPAIFLEQLLRMSLMLVDVLMLSWYSEAAVAAVGVTGNLVFFVSLLFLIVTTGCGITLGQHIGADKHEDAKQIVSVGFKLTLVVAALVAAIFYFGSHALISWYDLEEDVHDFAVNYALIIGSLSCGLALGTFYSTVLRAYGHALAPTIFHIVGGVLNVFGNYIALFGGFGFESTGMVGVAFATVISQSVVALFSWIYLKAKVNLARGENALSGFKKYADKILRLGIPSAGEGISYNLAQIVILYFVARLGTAALAATTIALTLARSIFIVSLSLGLGLQILTSYRVGRREFDRIKAELLNWASIAVFMSFSLALIMFSFGEHLLSFFTEDQDVQNYVMGLLLLWIFLEPGRAINLTVIFGLKGAGDVVFPVQVGIVLMWGVGVVFAYLFGLHWGFGLVGIWLGVALDEWLRGLIMIWRWKSDHWMNRSEKVLA